MENDIEQRAALAHMEADRVEIEGQLIIMEQQIGTRAGRSIISAHVRNRRFGRSSSRYSQADERRYQKTFAALRFERRSEIDIFNRKLTRQASAIAAFRACDGIPLPERAGS